MERRQPMIAEEDNQQEGEMTGRGGESVCGCVLQTEKSRRIKGIQSASIPLVTLIRMLPNVSIRKINIICTCCHLKNRWMERKQQCGQIEGMSSGLHNQYTRLVTASLQYDEMSWATWDIFLGSTEGPSHKNTHYLSNDSWLQSTHVCHNCAFQKTC